MFSLPNIKVFKDTVKKGNKRRDDEMRNAVGRNDTYRNIAMKYYNEKNVKKEKHILPKLIDKINKNEEYRTKKDEVRPFVNTQKLKILGSYEALG